jgi:nucleotide-binding universal stress UspA family protein
MLENILVPLDGSPVGESALPYAVALAGRSRARLTLRTRDAHTTVDHRSGHRSSAGAVRG